MTFFEDNMKLLLSQFPTYRPWAEAMSLWAIACASPNAYLPGGGRGVPLTFNPWAVGPSRLGFKSLVLNAQTDIIIDAGIPEIPPRMTVEATYKYIADNAITHGFISRDETAGLILETRKTYAADELSFLCELLDGRIRPRVTITHGPTPRMNIRANFASACTPYVFGLIDEGFWVQGVGNRLVPIYWMPSIKEQYGQPFDVDEMNWEYGCESAAAKLAKIYNSNVSRISFDNDDDAHTVDIMRYTEYRSRLEGYDTYFRDKWDITSAYKYECQMFKKKVAALRAVDRVEGEGEVHVKRADYDWASAWMDARLVEFGVMYDDWKEFQTRAKMKTVALTAGELILKVLNEKGGTMTKSALNNALCSKMDANTKNQALVSLTLEGRIDVQTVEGATKPTSVITVRQVQG